MLGLGSPAPVPARLADRRGARHRGRGALLARGPGRARRARAPRLQLRRSARALLRRLGRRAGALRRERQALDADVDRLPGWAVAQERGHQLGEPPRREAAPRSRPTPAGVHHFSPVTYSAASCSGVKRGTGSKRCVRTSTYRSTCPSQLPSRNGITCSRVQIHGPSSTSSSPASSASSRTIACSCVSPGSSPPPGVAHTTRARELEADEQDPVVRVEHDRPSGLPEPHSDSRNARNQRSRSAHGTAAFAGEVEGSTQSAVSPRRRSCAPSSARSPNAPR